jgi:hypothetical protein
LQKLEDGSAVIQLETAVGAAIEFFKGAKGINVSRRYKDLDMFAYSAMHLTIVPPVAASCQ